MDSKEYLDLISRLTTLKSQHKSGIDEEELLILESFLLLLRKEGYLEKIDSRNGEVDFRRYIQVIILDIKNVEISNLYDSHCMRIIDSTGELYFESLYNIYLSISNNFIDNSSKEFLKRRISYFLKSTKYFYKNSVIPLEELSVLMNFFCNIKEGSYYNPFAGTASLSHNISQKIQYIGEEVNYFTWILGNIISKFYNGKASDDYICENTFKLWIKNHQRKYDFIAFNPPFNIRIPVTVSELFSNHTYFNKSNANSIIISECFNRLKEDGKMVFIMPNGFLSSNSKIDKKLKKMLVNNGHLEKIIALPEKLFQDTSIPVNLILVNKKKREDIKVEFIDAKYKFIKDNSKVNVLDHLGIIQMLSDNNSAMKRSVAVEEIIENGYNLSINRYVFEGINLPFKENNKLKTLGEFLSILPKDSVLPDKYLKIVRIRDLSSDSFQFKKSFFLIEKRKTKHRVDRMQDKTLLLATIGKSLKPTLYREKGESIFYEPSLIFAGKVDENIIDTEYLIYELNKDYVQKQFEQFSSGMSVKRVSKRDLLRIKVVVPNKVEQQRRMLEFKQSIILESKHEFEELQKQLGIDIADENSFLRHKISGTLNNVIGSFAKLKNIIDSQVALKLPEVYSYQANSGYTSTLKDYLDRMDRDLGSIYESVKKAGVELSMRDMKFQNINFIKFIENYCNDLQNRPNINCEIWFENDEEDLRENKVKEIYVHADPNFLRQAFDNIVENAQNHGFDMKDHDMSLSGNFIEISLFYNFDRSEVELNFCNTGSHLPENFSFEAFIRKGSSYGLKRGDGIGGWLINEIVRAHQGKFEIKNDDIDNLGSMFPTRLILTFPMEIKV